MQTTTFEVNKLLKEGFAVTAKPLLIAEWNQNRYAGIEKVDNTPTEYDAGNDVEYFPIESIVEPIRPSKKGIVKTRANIGGVVSEYTDRPGGVRYYVGDSDDVYKYWASPVPSTNIGGQNAFATTCQPYVIYKTSCWTNKLNILFESSSAYPVDYKIDITTDGTTWTQIASMIPLSADGLVTLYHQANGTWTTTIYRDNPMKIKGIRIRVITLSALGRYMELIEMSARLEVDITSTLMNSTSNFNMSQESFITPLGNASSNTATVDLSNIDGRYNNSNEDSMYYGIIDKNVKFTYYMGFDTRPVGGVGFDYVREFTMFADGWNGQGEEVATVSLKDASKFLQEVKPPKMFFENMTLGRIVWQLCDIIGFTDYTYEKVDDDKATIVPYFWTDGEKTLWEIFSSLSSTTQSAIYFDEFGKLQILTRDTAYNIGKPVSWQLNGVKAGTVEPDIIDVTQTYDYEANNVTVRYNNTTISDQNSRTPVMDVAWQPEGDVVLRSNPIREGMTGTQTFLRMTSAQAAVWPYQGIVDVEGELVSYASKGYWYINKSGVAAFVELKSADEKKHVDEELTHTDFGYKSTFSGWMGGVKRGVWNTHPTTHYDDAVGYTPRIRGVPTYKVWTGGFVHVKNESLVSLRTNKTFTSGHTYVASHDSLASVWYVGTRLRFKDSGYTAGMAGIAFNLGDHDKGYYVEIARTDRMPGGRKYQNEINFYVRRSNGLFERFGPEGGKGVAMAISPNTWYDIDVSIRMDTGAFGPPNAFVGHVIQIAINGISKMTLTVPKEKKENLTGRYGMFVRGDTQADFEYVYGNGTTEDLRIDSTGFFDKIRGGIVSSQADSEWVYRWNTSSRIQAVDSAIATARYAQRLFDDFGPSCHEVRKFDVKFDKFPVVHSNLYFSNTSQVVCPEYKADPFGAKFVLANAYRTNAILNGEDTLTFGPDNAVEQKMMIYGRAITKSDEKTVITKNDDAIRRRGSVETEVQSEWIQSEAAAKSLSDWITHHWGEGCDEVEAEIFGNPLLQLGDVVSINYPQKDFDPIYHRYFVIGVVREFNGGYASTKLTLRRNNT